jgi:hypothetical protein
MYTNGDQSIFQIKNLPAAVISCHEIESFDNNACEQLIGSGAAGRYSGKFAWNMLVMGSYI